MAARLPSLNGLRAFEAAARHMSFTQAAAELNVTQTAISHLIRRLEQEIGVKLFVRQNRGLALTPEGRDYLPGVRTAFQDLRLATDRLLRKDDGRVLTVSTLASLAAKWLLPRIASFQEQHKEIDVRITTSSDLVDFHRDEIDGAIRYGRGQWSGVHADWLMADELFPVCSPALLEGKNPLRKPEDLANHTLLHTSRRLQRRLAAVAHRRRPAAGAVDAQRHYLRPDAGDGAGGDRRAWGCDRPHQLRRDRHPEGAARGAVQDFAAGGCRLLPGLSGGKAPAHRS